MLFQVGHAKKLCILLNVNSMVPWMAKGYLFSNILNQKFGVKDKEII